MQVYLGETHFSGHAAPDGTWCEEEASYIFRVESPPPSKKSGKKRKKKRGGCDLQLRLAVFPRLRMAVQSTPMATPG
jgi:hypothetical protein